jgi:hypothetical protein
MRTVFTQIYEDNAWANAESVSGGGSTLAFTEQLRELLPELVKKYEIRALLDAGCGDWNWMSQLSLDVPVVGVDVVAALIRENRRRYGGDFRTLDITKDELPRTDAVLCRAVLFHLSNKHVGQALYNFGRCGARWLLATTHPQVEKNVDIQDGEWRRLNLERVPFCLPAPLEMHADGPGDDGYLAVWRLA